MSVTRRRFLQTGTLAAAAASAADVSPLMAATDDMAPQQLPPGLPPEVLADPLWSIPRAAWSRHVGTFFTLYTENGREIGSLVLQRVTNLRSQQRPRPPAGQECFALLFRNRRTRDTLPQAVYVLEHGVLGRVKLLLVPTLQRRSPAPVLEAVINRVSFPA